MRLRRIALAAALAASLVTPALAQTDDNGQPKRTRVRVGALLIPDYPGADSNMVGPWLGLSFAKAGQDFEFAAADDAPSLALIHTNGFSFGPLASLVGKRKAKDTGYLLPEVKLSVELGGFAQIGGEHFRLRGEVRQGVTGHKALIGTVGADFIARDHDNWLFAIGPRYTLASGKYERAYFGVVTPVPAAGLTAYRPDGGSNAFGGTTSASYALSPRWGVTAFAKYDRLIGDAGRSPVVRRLGDRDQLSGGAGLTFTF